MKRSEDPMTAKNPRVSDPIILRAERNGREFVVRPCSGKHRNLFLSGYLVMSCSKCGIRPVDEEHTS